jgi:predicted component of type VI protein secretion system
VIFGGVGMEPQKQALRAGIDVLVATPGRLLDLAGQGLVDLNRSRSSSSTRPTACSTWASSTTSGG